MPRIVVLDGYTLNPGDLSWAGLESLGRCEIHDRTPAERVVARAAGAQIALTNKTVLDGAILEALPALRYVGVLATGYNVVDLPAARRRGIVVTNVPAYSTASVAQMVFALLLELTHHVGDHSRAVRQGRWSSSKDFCWWDWPLIELDGLTMGIVGYGRIGRRVARIARAIGMTVVAYDPAAEAKPRGVSFVGLDELFRTADVVTLHCPLTERTDGLVNAARIRRMKPTAFLINTSRGPVVDEKDLAEALNAGRIAGAAVDVLATEPPPPDNPLLGARNCLLTPHVAWATRAARQRLMDAAVANVRAFLAGGPRNVVGAEPRAPRGGPKRL